MLSLSLVGDTGSPGDLRAFVRAADAAGFDLILFGYADGGLTLDPISAAAALFPLTQRMAFGAAIGADHAEPYTVARGLAALDHLSGGRSAWQVATRPGEGLDRLREFVGVVLGLWDGWDRDALVHDKEAAVFSLSDKVRRLDHLGAHFQVRGPLNTPPPASGRPLMVFTDDAPADLIAASADVVIVRADDIAAARAARRSAPQGVKMLVETAIADAMQRRAWIGDVCDGLHVLATLGDSDRLAEVAR